MAKQEGFPVKTSVKAGVTWRERYDAHLKACSQKYETLLAVPTCIAHAAFQATFEDTISKAQYMTDESKKSKQGYPIRSDVKAGESWLSRYLACREEGGNIVVSDLKCTLRATRDTFFPKGN